MADNDFNDIKKVLTENNIGVLSTASKDGKTEAATIEFVFDGKDVYFTTQTTTRKYKNIKENPQGSLVISKVPDNVQIDGIIQELGESDKDIIAQLMTSNLGQSPSFYKENEKWKFFRFTPKEIRSSHYPKKPSRFEKFEER